MLIFIPKCIELSSESKPKLILVSGLGLGITQDPHPIYSFFWRNVWSWLHFSWLIRSNWTSLNWPKSSLFKFVKYSKGILKQRNICYDDLMWSDEGNLGFVLDCVYPNITSVRLLEASAVFTIQMSSSYWSDSRYDRPDCDTQIQGWNVYQMNFTFSTQINCNRNLIPILDPNAGVFCRITKNFLWLNVFKPHADIISSGKVFYPFPYGFVMRYTCF